MCNGYNRPPTRQVRGTLVPLCMRSSDASTVGEHTYSNALCRFFNQTSWGSRDQPDALGGHHQRLGSCITASSASSCCKTCSMTLACNAWNFLAIRGVWKCCLRHWEPIAKIAQNSSDTSVAGVVHRHRRCKVGCQLPRIACDARICKLPRSARANMSQVPSGPPCRRRLSHQGSVRRRPPRSAWPFASPVRCGQ